MEQRIRKIIDDLGLSQSDFAKQIGVERANISHILSGRHKPSYDFLRKVLLTFPNLNAEWLILGKGKAYKTDNQQDKIDLQNTQDTKKKQEPEKKVEITKNNANNSNIDEKKDKSENNIEQNSNDTKQKSLFSEPEQILILYDDKTFSTYKKRDDAN